MFRRFIDAIYDGLLSVGDDDTLEMGNYDGPDHPVGEGLQLTDTGTAREFQDAIAEEVQVALVPGEDPRLAEVSLTFVDEHGVSREWSATHHDYDSENYHD